MIKNVTDFNVADSVRRDIKVLVTKTRYTVCIKLFLIMVLSCTNVNSVSVLFHACKFIFKDFVLMVTLLLGGLYHRSSM